MLDKLVNAWLSTGTVFILTTPRLHVQIVRHCTPEVRRFDTLMYPQLSMRVQVQDITKTHVYRKMCLVLIESPHSQALNEMQWVHTFQSTVV